MTRSACPSLARESRGDLQLTATDRPTCGRAPKYRRPTLSLNLRSSYFMTVPITQPGAPASYSASDTEIRPPHDRPDQRKAPPRAEGQPIAQAWEIGIQENSAAHRFLSAAPITRKGGGATSTTNPGPTTSGIRRVAERRHPMPALDTMWAAAGHTTNKHSMTDCIVIL